MVGTALLIIAMSMVAFATVLHFWIYVRLESAGIVVEYFTTARKAYRTYRVYRITDYEQPSPASRQDHGA